MMERYEPGFDCDMKRFPNGDWVKYSDYAELKKQREEAIKIGLGLIRRLTGSTFGTGRINLERLKERLIELDPKLVYEPPKKEQER